MEANCRVIPALPGKCALGDKASKWRKVLGETGEELLVTSELNKESLRQDLSKIKNEMGINSIAVALAHSYTYKDHEIEVGKIAKELGKLNKLGNYLFEL